METASGRCLSVCLASNSALFPAASPTRRMRSGRSSATLIVLVPMDPVLPRRTTFFIIGPITTIKRFRYFRLVPSKYKGGRARHSVRAANWHQLRERRARSDAPYLAACAWTGEKPLKRLSVRLSPAATQLKLGVNEIPFGAASSSTENGEGPLWFWFGFGVLLNVIYLRKVRLPATPLTGANQDLISECAVNLSLTPGFSRVWADWRR